MNNTTYYLPIKSSNLAHYFAKGCICPTKYIENRNEDIQNEFNNFLLLTKSKFTQDTNCSLEIVINDKLENVNEISKNFFLLDIPLPISRVKKIIFKEEKQKVNTTYDITSGAAFLPIELIEVELNGTVTNSAELKQLKINLPNKNWTSEIDLFNRIMGGFAIMSIAGCEFQNYPLNYFNTLANINTIVKDEITNQSIEVKDNYEWTLFENGKYTSLHNAIYSQINNSIVETFAKNDKINLSKQNGKFLLHKIDQNKATYLIAVLASFGQGARMTVDSFISDLVSSKFPEKKKEGLALIFGINKGYEIFRNKYKTDSFQVNIKFKLDSQLDYYTIESIYQFTFNKKKKNSSFEYIDNWCPKLNENETNNKLETYQVLDKTIFYKKKEEIFSQESSQDFSRNNIYEKIVLEIQKWIPSYLKDKNKTEGLKHFKNLLENDFEQYTNNVIEKTSNKTNILNANKLDVLRNKTNSLKQIIKEKEIEIKNLKADVEKLNTQKEYLKPKIESLNKSDSQNHNNNIEQNPLEKDLFSSPTLSKKDIRSAELLKMGITNLKKLAKEKSIGNLTKYKKSNIQDLIDIVINKEFN
ncbi:hypothetical protein [Tenacibaculum finnmarkense]|uniref:hypothetical protein n=1 Tax=Tenacibaculum finnmarkense TaxID=2781243 RepID=UPI001EFB89DF|nr:hypothetical protein [Tenacibaculum finnmarkense]MCG8751538.1 hypothetical protein [Tenacibaculum finnmarkense]MCG8770605.1 hypothetical protein [Tenacibaculum finnmarkense]MCG8775623.1 hypothetical protein [Tenacibaculum finnmarkense]MCG8872750.1 hypothetical protein [Tenacibaculum finnmarkense]